MPYVTAKDTKSKKIIVFKCNTQDEALTVMENLARNSYEYKYVTLRKSSPYKRGAKIKIHSKKTLPTIFRKG